MTTMIRLLMVPVVVAGWLTAACVPMRVSVYTAPQKDVTTYRTYRWAAGELGATGDPRLDNNQFFRERVQRAADAQLAFRGFEPATAGAPDLVLYIHARVAQRIDAGEIDRESGRCQISECQTQVFDEGTLLIDLVDSRTNALVWRGWAERSLEGVIDNQEWMNQVIDKAVASIFGRLPMRVL